jgi:hypothetical protein
MELNPIAWLDATDPNGDRLLPIDDRWYFNLYMRWVDKTGIAENATKSDPSKQPYIEHNVFKSITFY